MEPDTTPVQESLSPGKAFVLQKKHYLPIKEWDIQDRPREKFLSGHRPDMPDEELLAILIGSGTENLSALDIAKRILEHFNGNLESLSSRSAKELARKFTGIGTAKAVSILAGMELGRRSFKPQQETELIINSSEKAFQFLRRDHQPVRGLSEPAVPQGNRLHLQRLSGSLPHPCGHAAFAGSSYEGLRGRPAGGLYRYRLFQHPVQKGGGHLPQRVPGPV